MGRTDFLSQAAWDLLEREGPLALPDYRVSPIIQEQLLQSQGHQEEWDLLAFLESQPPDLLANKEAKATLVEHLQAAREQLEQLPQVQLEPQDR